MKIMYTYKINNALQELITRLQDAEKGYIKLSSTTTNSSLKKWLEKYASERHSMHQALEGHMVVRGAQPEDKSSLLGSLHRLFINVKIDTMHDDFGAIVNEIKRGSKVLISDYQKVLDEVQMSPILATTLESQKLNIEREVNELDKLKLELESK